MLCQAELHPYSTSYRRVSQSLLLSGHRQHHQRLYTRVPHIYAKLVDAGLSGFPMLGVCLAKAAELLVCHPFLMECAVL